MLSRTADNLYWVSPLRRAAEYLAPHPRRDPRLAPCRPPTGARATSGRACVADRGRRRRPSRRSTTSRTSATSREFLAFSPDNPSSIRSCLELARSNARAVRTALTAEMWEAINSAWLRAASATTARRMSREEFARFLDWVKSGVADLRRLAPTARCCATTPTGSRASASIIERADNTARILDVKYHVLLPRDRAGRRRPRLLPVVDDPARGLGADRLSLGLSREPEAVAGGGPADPQPADAALARLLLREPGALPRRSRRRLRPPGRRRSGCRARSWRAWRTRASRTSSSSGLHEFISGFIADNSQARHRPSPTNISSEAVRPRRPGGIGARGEPHAHRVSQQMTYRTRRRRSR